MVAVPICCPFPFPHLFHVPCSPFVPGTVFNALPASDNASGKTNYTNIDYPDGIGYEDIYRHILVYNCIMA